MRPLVLVVLTAMRASGQEGMCIAFSWLLFVTHILIFAKYYHLRIIVCLTDSPDGFGGKTCQEYIQERPEYCHGDGQWNNDFRSACPVTCKTGRDTSIPKKVLANIM